MIELLWFYGDIYDEATQEVHKGRCVVVVDGNTVVYDGYEPKSKIFKGSWKPRPDSLWSQGPLDNLVGINYMVNHSATGGPGIRRGPQAARGAFRSF